MAGAFNWNGPTPMGLASYVQGQGDYGRQRGEDSRLARLVSGAMADPSKRQANLAEMASVRPEAAYQAQGQFDQQTDRKYAELGKRAAVLAGAPEAMRGQVWAQLRPELEQTFGMQGLPAEVTPEIIQTAQQLAQVYGGGQSGGVSVRSSFVGEDGNMYSIMSDGSVKAQGIGADRKLQAFDVPGVGPQVVDLRNATARTVTAGNGQPAPRQAPASQFAFTPAPGAESDPAAADFQNLAPDQQQVAAQLLQRGQDFTIQNGRVVPAAARGGQPMNVPASNRDPGANSPLLRTPITELGGGDERGQRPAWVRPVSNTSGSAPPSGYRFRADGGLEFIPGGPADPANKPQAQDKPIPVGALRLQLEAEEALTGAEGVIDELDRIDQQLKSGALDLGLFSNLANKAKNFAGMSDEESRAYGAFTSTLERLRNESLRLNKGVQTEGDSQRAWNELIADINDPKNVQTQIERIQRYNRRAVELQQRKMHAVQQNYQGKAAADSPEDDIDALLAEFGN